MINWGIHDFLGPEYLLNILPLYYNMDLLEIYYDHFLSDVLCADSCDKAIFSEKGDVLEGSTSC